MAKQSMGYLDGFSGRLGPVVGYMWNGKWCLRAHNRQIHNPRTAAQVAQRDLFRQEVQLAASMRRAVVAGLTAEARLMGMTSYNLFVHLNQQAFSLVDSKFRVDYSRLLLSVGDVAPVEAGEAHWTADNVLTVGFGKGAGRSHDWVYLYVYAPALGRGCLSAPVFRRDKRISLALPDDFAGCEVQLYLMVQDEKGDWGDSVYGGAMTLDENALKESGVETLVETEEIYAAGGAGKGGVEPAEVLAVETLVGRKKALVDDNGAPLPALGLVAGEGV